VKVLLIPVAGILFVLFLLVLGTIGLAVATATIAFFGKIGSLLTGRGRRRRERATAQQG
jgi:TRAP-type mannitol/chloroaromatic compound transport system permease large subunit